MLWYQSIWQYKTIHNLGKHEAQASFHFVLVFFINRNNMPRRQENLHHRHNVHNKLLFLSMHLLLTRYDPLQRALYPKFDCM